LSRKNHSNRTCRQVHDLLLFQTSFVWVQRFMSRLHKTKYEFNLSTSLHFRIFFSFFTKTNLLKVIRLLKIYQHNKSILSRWRVQVLHPSKKFERPPFWNGLSCVIKTYGLEVTFTGVTFLQNIMKLCRLVQKL
jgi:hypothetical protein